AVLVAALTVIACGAGAAGSSVSRATVAVTDADNGRTVTVAPGDRLTVTLGSTYWTFSGSSNAAVLRQVGQPVASPGTCPPAGGRDVRGRPGWAGRRRRVALQLRGGALLHRRGGQLPRDGRGGRGLSGAGLETAPPAGCGKRRHRQRPDSFSSRTSSPMPSV